MRRTLWAVTMVVALGGCARTAPGVYAPQRRALSVVDDFNLLLMTGGLPAHLLPSEGRVTVKDAQRLLAELKLRRTGPSTYAPQQVVEALLRDVLTANKELPRAEVNRRLQKFEGLAVLTPEGFMAWALTGEPVEWEGGGEVVGGVPRARGYVVGSLYAPSGSRDWRQVAWTEAVKAVEEGSQEKAARR